MRTHANFPWHHAALLRAVGVDDDDSLPRALATFPAEEIEERAFDAGGVAAAVRSSEEWLAHPQGRALAGEPLVGKTEIEGSGRARRRPAVHDPVSGAPLPAAGVRVLDLTRVIAGPVCSRFLGALGADVLRIDPPRLPDLEPGRPADTLLGKRSAFLDLDSSEGAARLEELLSGADVVLLGYRPGSLSRFGLGAGELADRHPGLVVVELAAWGHRGPWAGRRGFDSIVQAATGIAAAEARDGAPGALPCQLLDHGTGYLAAAAALEALLRQEAEGGTHLRHLSLARTAHWLLDESLAESEAGAVAGAWTEEGAAHLAPIRDDPTVEAIPPPGTLAGAPLAWPGPPARYGDEAPAWRCARQDSDL